MEAKNSLKLPSEKVSRFDKNEVTKKDSLAATEKEDASHIINSFFDIYWSSRDKSTQSLEQQKHIQTKSSDHFTSQNEFNKDFVKSRNVSKQINGLKKLSVEEGQNLDPTPPAMIVI